MKNSNLNTKPKSPTNGWTPERRTKQAASIRRWSPWIQSTGPRTAAGKARVAQNAAKAGRRMPDPDRVINAALKSHRRYLTELNRYLTQRKFFGQNKLMESRRRALLKLGHACTMELHGALIYAKLCKNLASAPPLTIKVNDNLPPAGTLANAAGLMAMELL